MDFKNERLMMSEEEIRKRAKELLNENQADLIIKCMFLEQQAKKQKEVIDRAIEYINSQMTSYDSEEDCGVDCECDGFKLLDILKEVSE